MNLSFYLSSVIACCLVTGAAASLPKRATDWASIRCPQDSTLTLPTPTYGDIDAVFTICTEQLINAPLELVYDTLIDFSSYHLWNSFVVDVEVPPDTKTPEGVYIDMPMTFITSGIIPLINTTSAEIVTRLEKNIPTWRGNVIMLGVLIVAEHPNILVDQGNGTTRYVSYETYYNEPLLPSLLALKPALKRMFARQGKDLRAYVESRVS